jgi:CRISPR-associated endonuclease/helicase Cas3
MEYPVQDEIIQIARFSDDRTRKQPLSCHLQRVSSLAGHFASKIGLQKIAAAIGAFHDMGKGREEFQNYIRDKDGRRGSVEHSIFGAKSLYESILSTSLPLGELVANIIASHHGSLQDFITPDGQTPLADKLASIDVISDSQMAAENLLTELKSLLANSTCKTYAMACLVKMLYSCLVDADRLDAYLFETQQEYIETTQDWKALLQNLVEHVSSKNKCVTEMTALRNSVSNQCADSGLQKQGIYKLEVPTGGGKTLSSLRFALVHANQHHLDRIIYVIPYLSILSQTAEEIRSALKADDEIVLEHHSNILPDEPEYYKLHTDRWDKPIILTTQVQFLESIFSAKGSDLRKFHNMAKSVIIFDEAQNVPVKCIHLFNGALNFLTEACKSTILLCTATQPLLDAVERPIVFTDKKSIAICDQIPQRTNIVNALRPAGYTYGELTDFIMNKHNISTLVIVNTKAAAKAVFLQLKNKKMPVLHLSTNMCPQHRDLVIEEVKKRLNPEIREPVICVSTQLIEAGVDISFECVVRDVAGLDSIYQAAGRCNRHGEFREIKDVFVVNIKDGNLNKLPDIKMGVEVTRRLFNENKIDINEFYKLYFHARKSIMDYPIDKGTIYDLLSMNCQGHNAYKNVGNVRKIELRQAPRSASDAFYVIAPGQTEVVVPYGESNELLKDYAKQDNITQKKVMLQKIGKFCVSLYKFQLDALEKRGAVTRDQGMCILAKGFYDKETGVDLAGNHEFLYV